MKTPAGKSFMMAVAQQDHDADVLMSAFEHEYKAQAEDGSVLLIYLNQRCQAVFDLNLPKGKTYKVEVIDTWNMTKSTASECAEENMRIKLPGRPYMAVLATETDN